MTQNDFKNNSWFLKMDAMIMKVLKVISYVSGIIMAVIAVIVTVNVITSKLFHWSVPSCNDWVTYLFMGVVYCSCAYCKLDKGGLVSVDLITAKAPTAYRTVISLFSDIAGIVIFFLFSKYGFQLLQTNFQTRIMSSTGAGAFLLWPFNALLVIGCSVMTFAMIWDIFRLIRNALNKDKRGGDNR